MSAPHPSCPVPVATRSSGDAPATASGRPAAPPGPAGQWQIDTCPVCGYAKADVDPDGVLWCPACGYSKKGCYT
ncbi:MAG: hypothetical protein Kow0031_06630 [Anaerolineae bacterium]